MGLLNFINRRQMDEGPVNRANGVQDECTNMNASVQSLQPRRLSSREIKPHAMMKRRSMNILPGSGKPYLRRHSAGNNGSEPSLRSYHSANKLHQIISTETKSLTPSILSVSVTGRSIPSLKASGHIDLLDAQGGIRPCDFRTRIHAAGVRDYGEDVAERNIGENGVDVQSAAARDFYRRKMNKKQSFYTHKTADTAHVLEADQSTCGGSTVGDGSDNGDVRSVDGTAICSASLSRLSLQPESNAAGQLQRSRAKSWNPQAFEAALASASPPRMSRREAFDSRQDFTKRQTTSTLPRERSLERKFRISIARSVSESREAYADSRDRSMSPPDVPRYRARHDLQSPTETELTSLSHEAFDSDLDPAAMSDDDILEYGISLPAAVPIRSARPRLIAVAPQHTNAEWQSAIRTAVEESLASLPQTTDLKALLELSNDALSLSDVADQVPPRHSSLKQGYISCSSTPTTVTSGYASSTTGRPHSRQTTATSIDFSTQIDLYSKIAYGGSSDGRGSSVGHHHHATPSADLDDLVRPQVTFDLPLKSKQEEELSLCQPYGCVEVHDLDSFTSDLSDVDSFTTARCRAPDDESLLFNEDKFADAGSNLPGLVTAANNCMICHVVANLQGTPVPTVPCNHNGTTTRKQRLRALGYDYDSDESEPEPITTSPRTRTKWLTSGANGGLRRLKLVDDCIEEASDEEDPPVQEIRRKHKFSELRTAHEDGNLADTE